MVLRSWLVLPSLIRFLVALVATRTSKAATIPPPMPGHQPLGEDDGQRRAELDADLVLPVPREHVDDAIHGLGRVVRVEGGEHQVAGLGHGERDLDGFEVAHLADEEDVGVLAEGGAQGPFERGCVGADRPLVDHRPLVVVEVLDRVLDGQDVELAMLVDVVDDRGQCGGLARPGRPGHEHEAAGKAGEPFGDRGETQLAPWSGSW